MQAAIGFYVMHLALMHLLVKKKNANNTDFYRQHTVEGTKSPISQ